MKSSDPRACSTLIAAFAALLALPASATEDADSNVSRRHVLLVSAAPASVTIAPASDRRNSIVLPALDYEFSLSARCATSFTPDTVTLTIADSQAFLQSSQLEGAPAVTDMTLTVPARQLAPLIVEEFCTVAASPANEIGELVETQTLTISATLSANASLLCASGSKREIIYTTTPLDVTLVCAAAEATEQED